MKRSLFIVMFALFLIGCGQVNETSLPKETLVVVETGNETTTPPVTEVIRADCPYQCCVGTEYKNKLCDADEYCDEDNTCKKYDCIEDSGCSGSEYCSDYTCLGVSCGSCEYADNHQCLQYQCCENADCSEGECVNHVCEVLYKFDLSSAPISADQNKDSKFNALPYLFRKNGYEYTGGRYCLIDNSTYANINNCDAELLTLDVNEGQVYILQSVWIANTSGNYNFETINAFLILYSKIYANYYTVKIDDKTKEKAIISTTARNDLEEFAYGEIAREEFLSRVLRKD